MTDKSKIYIIDGHGYLFRAFYAIQNLSNSKGFPTNAIFGFTNMLLKFLKEEKPTYVAIVFDTPTATFREKIYADYKAQRKATPQDLSMQIPYVKKIINALGINILEKEGFEADDIIATISEKFKHDCFIYIISGDKDLLQLISDNVNVYDTMKDIRYSRQEVIKKFGVPPERLTDFFALTGDSTDNIPGIKGIGEKTASELLNAFSSLDDIFANSSTIQKPKIRNLVEQGKESALISKQLVSLNKNIPLEISLDEFKLSNRNDSELKSIFQQLEFFKLLSEIQSTSTFEEKYRTITTENELNEFVEKIIKTKILYFVLNLQDKKISGVALGTENFENAYIPISHTLLSDKNFENLEFLWLTLKNLFENREITKISFDIKTIKWNLYEKNISLIPPYEDAMILWYGIDLFNTQSSIEEMSSKILNIVPEYLSLIQQARSKRSTSKELDVNIFSRIFCEKVSLLKKIHQNLIETVKKTPVVQKNIYEVDYPLIEILFQMEKNGIKVNQKRLIELSNEFEKKLSVLKKEIWEIAGEEFNIDSPKQLREILFVKLKLQAGKKKKTGYSTDVEELTRLSSQHTIASKILDYRSMAKMKNGYIDSIGGLINPNTSRVHTMFHQAGTTTGRITSSEPNLQNIPVRTDEGKAIRSMFVAEEGYSFVSFDYSQIELRLLAHLSDDENLKKLFSKGADIHTLTACEIFNVDVNLVTPQMRRQAKAINFGIIYGMSAHGLSTELGIPHSIAQHYIDSYFKKFQKVKMFLDKTIEDALQKNNVQTFFGRKRTIPELNSTNESTKNAGIRAALNTPLQGTAADLIRLSMIKCFNIIKEKNLNAKLILQIHDELIFEVKDEDVKGFIEIVKPAMENILPSFIPFSVEVKTGKSWSE